jgi:multiple sugar transport system ATP-binding protein
LGLTELLDRSPNSLSGGQRQRVALGRAIVREPQVFLFDEPLSHLDAHLRLRTRSEIKRLHQALKTTSIYVTHDQDEAMALGQRVAVMSEGVLHQCDTPTALRERPVNRFVAEFIGSPPMNFVPGHLVPDGAGGLQFESPGVHCTVTSAQAASLVRHLGDVVLGVRPECLAPAAQLREPPTETRVACLRATLEAIDCAGPDFDHHFVLESGARGVARLRSAAGEMGTVLDWHFDPREAFFFAPDRPGSPVSYGANLMTLTP